MASHHRDFHARAHSREMQRRIFKQCKQLGTFLGSSGMVKSTNSAGSGWGWCGGIHFSGIPSNHGHKIWDWFLLAEKWMYCKRKAKTQPTPSPFLAFGASWVLGARWPEGNMGWLLGYAALNGTFKALCSCSKCRRSRSLLFRSLDTSKAWRLW